MMYQLRDQLVHLLTQLILSTPIYLSACSRIDNCPTILAGSRQLILLLRRLHRHRLLMLLQRCRQRSQTHLTQTRLFLVILTLWIRRLLWKLRINMRLVLLLLQNLLMWLVGAVSYVVVLDAGCLLSSLLLLLLAHLLLVRSNVFEIEYFGWDAVSQRL